MMTRTACRLAVALAAVTLLVSAAPSDAFAAPPAGGRLARARATAGRALRGVGTRLRAARTWVKSPQGKAKLKKIGKVAAIAGAGFLAGALVANPVGTTAVLAAGGKAVLSAGAAAVPYVVGASKAVGGWMIANAGPLAAGAVGGLVASGKNPLKMIGNGVRKLRDRYRGARDHVRSKGGIKGTLRSLWKRSDKKAASSTAGQNTTTGSSPILLPAPSSSSAQ